jgi:hypothetical protein
MTGVTYSAMFGIIFERDLYHQYRNRASPTHRVLSKQPLLVGSALYGQKV